MSAKDFQRDSFYMLIMFASLFVYRLVSPEYHAIYGFVCWLFLPFGIPIAIEMYRKKKITFFRFRDKSKEPVDWYILLFLSSPIIWACFTQGKLLGLFAIIWVIVSCIVFFGSSYMLYKKRLKKKQTK